MSVKEEVKREKEREREREGERERERERERGRERRCKYTPIYRDRIFKLANEASQRGVASHSSHPNSQLQLILQSFSFGSIPIPKSQRHEWQTKMLEGLRLPEV